jgi:hypothetical protein
LPAPGFRDEVVGLDRVGQRVLCRHRPAVPYDFASISIGSTPQVAGVRGAAEHAVAVKPIHRFNERWLALLERVRHQRGAMTIALVGGGAGGVELALAMQYRLRREIQALGRDPDDLHFHLFTDADQVLPTHNAGVRGDSSRSGATRRGRMAVPRWSRCRPAAEDRDGATWRPTKSSGSPRPAAPPGWLAPVWRWTATASFRSTMCFSR